MTDEILNRVIQIESMSEDMKKVNIQTGKDKFALWKKKLDGAETKAYENFQGMGVKVGDIVNLAYKQEDAEFTNEKGQNVQFKRRTIIALKEAEGQSPEAAPQSSTGYGPVAKTPLAEPGIYVLKADYDKKMEDLRESYLFLTQEFKALKDKVDGEPPF